MTINQIKSLVINNDLIWKYNPCYDPAEILPEKWHGNIIDFLNYEEIPTEDRIWFITNLLDKKENILFACWCCRQIWDLLTDKRSRNAVIIAEKYANGEATLKELEKAAGAAGGTAREAGAATWAARTAEWAASRAAENGTLARQNQINYLINIFEETE